MKIQKVLVVGANTLGLIEALWLKEKGYKVTLLDISVNKINLLNKGFHFNSLSNDKSIEKFNEYHLDISFTNAISVLSCDFDMIFVCEPTIIDGKFNYRYFDDMLNHIIKKVEYRSRIIIRNVVELEKIELIDKKISENKNIQGIIYLPLQDYDKIYEEIFNPNRIVVGINSDIDHFLVSILYRDFIEENIEITYTNPISAESISFINSYKKYLQEMYKKTILKLMISYNINYDDIENYVGTLTLDDLNEYQKACLKIYE